MPRSRNIKPGLCQNPELAELSCRHRLLFAVLPCFADREGRLEDRPLKLKMQIFPADNCDMDELLQDLHGTGMVQRYRIGESKYIQIVNFDKHQNPHVHEKPSEIPPAPKQGVSTTQAPEQHRSNPADSLSLDSLSLDSLNPSKPLCGEPHVGGGQNRDPVRRVFEFWQETHGHPRAKLDDKRRKKIKARLADGYSEDDLLAAIRGCKKSPHHMGENDTGTVYDDLELICRDGPHVDKFIRLDSGPDKTRMSGSARKTSSAAQKWLEEGHAEQ